MILKIQLNPVLNFASISIFCVLSVHNLQYFYFQRYLKRVRLIYQKFYKITVFGGTVFRATGFGLLAASKNAPLKLHPKNRTPKKTYP